MVTRLRALHVGLEQMAHDASVSIPRRVSTLLEPLVPGFADQVACQFPGSPAPALEVGKARDDAHTLEASIHAPQREAGRLTARRTSAFTPEDSAILQSAANAISTILCLAHTT